MKRYAEGTKVEPEASIAEIRKYAELRGAANFTYAMGNAGGVIRFRLGGRWMQFTVALDDDTDRREHMRLWRVVLLKVKSAFEVYAAGEDTTVEEAFMPYLMLPDGTTVGDRVAEDIPRMYAGEIESMDLFRPALAAGGRA